MAIRTIDGVVRHAWDKCWVISYSEEFEKYFTIQVKAQLVGVNKLVFDSKKLCTEQCNLMNQDRIQVVPTTPESFDGNKTDYIINDELGQWQHPDGSFAKEKYKKEK